MKLIAGIVAVLLVALSLQVGGRTRSLSSTASATVSNGMAVDADPSTVPTDASRTISGRAVFHIGVNVTSATTPYQGYQVDLSVPSGELHFVGTTTPNPAGGMNYCQNPETLSSGPNELLRDGCVTTTLGGVTNTGQQETVDLQCVNDGTFTVHMVTAQEDSSFGTTTLAPDASFIPTSTADATITCQATGVFTVTNTNNSGPGSLRQAILDSNNHPLGPNTIQFTIAPGGIATIAVSSALPTVAAPVLIDGTSQPGFSGSPLIKVDGTNAGTGSDGLVITAGNTTVKGLAIDRFPGNGIVLSTNGGDIVEGNFVGLDVPSPAPAANGGDGIRVSTSTTTIGSFGLGNWNIIVSNGAAGVHVLSGVDNRISTGAMHANSSGGIVLAAGANNNPPTPVLSSASSDGASTSIQGTLTAAASTLYRLEFFSDTVCDGSGAGQGRIPLGSSQVMTNGAGSGAISTTANVPTTPGQIVSATATDPAGNTSQFSACVTGTSNHYCTVRRADENGDGTVNILDLTIVAHAFLQPIPVAAARLDQNGDGVINILDLSQQGSVFLGKTANCP